MIPLAYLIIPSRFLPCGFPPKEHFVALKSYVAGLAEIGIARLFRASYLSSEYDPESAAAGFNSLMQKQIAGALLEVAPRPARIFLQDFLLDLFAHATPVWIEPRLPYLDVTYNISNLIFHDAQVLASAKLQFPAYPWDEWAEIVKIKWNDLKEWAEWFSRIETIPIKGDSPYGLPVIGVDYPKFAQILRESRIEELADRFSMDTTFANTCRLVFHVVIEEENWGGASVEGKRELGIVALESLGGIVWLLASLWIWGQNALTAIIGLFFYFFFITCCELWRKRHKKNKATKIRALNGSDSQNTI